jgi:16S rRNA (guanine966-N2)-methyltransferase
MRIIAGSAKGLPLRAPTGQDTRPTSDKVRGAMFSMLEARLTDGLAGLSVLDLFAGSGALALEALSRGATQAVAVDCSSAAHSAIHANAAKAGFDSACEALRMGVEVAIERLGREGRQFQLVLADPPYAADIQQLVEAIERSGVVAAGGLVMVEHSRRQQPAEKVGGLALEVRRRHGDTVVSLYRAPD